jgi:hypothetical protein
MKVVWIRPPPMMQGTFSNLLAEPVAPTLESIKSAIRMVKAIERRQQMHVVKPRRSPP